MGPTKSETSHCGAWTGRQAAFRRFLLTGDPEGVYRPGPLRLDPDAATAGMRHLLDSIRDSGAEVIETIVAASSRQDASEAYRAEAALFALALGASPRFAPAEVNSQALAALPLVARRAQDLAVFSGYVSRTRGWGRGLRTAVADWYAAHSVDALASQLVRGGPQRLAAHRTLLRLAHPKAAPGDLARNALYQWIADGRLGHLATPEIREGELRLVHGAAQLRNAATTLREALALIEEYRLPPSVVPARWRGEAAVWEALFDSLAYRQLLRYLPAMTSSGFLNRGRTGGGSDAGYTALAVARLVDRKRLQAARIHPVEVARAMVRYRRLLRGAVVEPLFDALDEALAMSAACCQPPIGGRLVVALDATASMQGAPVAGLSSMPASLASAALSLAWAMPAMGLRRARGAVSIVPFWSEAGDPVEVHRGSRIASILNQVRPTPSRANAAAVIDCARHKREPVDAFVILTDRLAPGDAPALLDSLRQYRDAMGAGVMARLAVVQLAASPQAGPGAAAAALDCGVAWFAGFDVQAPAALYAFLAGPGPADSGDETAGGFAESQRW